jgi:hypothetical protein
MKDKGKRPIPLRPELPAALRAGKARRCRRDATRVLVGLVDLRNDGLGHVVHFHLFRKTLQTLGARSGVNQRATQEILGHSDANLTAQAYTDVAGLELHREIAKLSWITPTGVVAQHGAQNSGVSRPSLSLADICAQLVEAVKVTDAQSVSHALASSVTSSQKAEMAARAGIEPATK